jgi:hypothetical protein
LHVFSTYYLPYYLLVNSNVVSVDVFIYFGNAPLNFPYRYGCFKSTSVYFANKGQFEEAKILRDRGVLEFDSYSIATAGSKAKEYSWDLGFFSEGWWLRRSGDGFSIENVDALKKKLAKNRPLKAASLEFDLLGLAVNFAKENNLRLAIFLHPSECRMVEKGISSPYLKFIDNENIFIGENILGISDFASAKIGITMLPSSSIITDRGALGLKTMYLNSLYLEKYSLFHQFEKLYVAETDIPVSHINDFPIALFDNFSIGEG